MEFKIKHITIDKLFGNKKFDYELSDINIIGGKNGSGKSTILKSCYYLLNKGFIPEETNLLPVLGEIQITFTNGWTLLWSRSNELSNWTDVVNGQSMVLHNNVFQNIILKNDKGISESYTETKQKINTYLATSFEQYISESAKLLAVYSSVDKATDITYLDILIEDQLNIRNKNFSGTMEQIFSLFKDAQTTNNTEIKIREQDDVKSYLDFYPVLNSFFKTYGISITSNLTFNRGVDIPYQRLSMGEKQLLYILLLASNTGKESSILFLDEPDLGMHIEWKEKLVKALHRLAPNAQIILSTHAPSLIKGWRECVSEMSQLISEN